jgi:1,4-alpha-glucan branching enzyme
MPGDEWQKFANLRLLYSYMFMHPGGKLLFMGNEFGVSTEWNYKTELSWHLLQYHYHKGVQNCIKDLCHLLKSEPALHEGQFKPEGFAWIDLYHRDESVMAFMRKGKKTKENILVLMNMTPVVRNHWEIKVSENKEWKEIYNSDHQRYGGSGDIFNQQIKKQVLNDESGMISLIINLPPLAVIVLK